MLIRRQLRWHERLLQTLQLQLSKAALTSLGAPWGTSRFRCGTAAAGPEIVGKLPASSEDPRALKGHTERRAAVRVEPSSGPPLRPIDNTRPSGESDSFWEHNQDCGVVIPFFKRQNKSAWAAAMLWPISAVAKAASGINDQLSVSSDDSLASSAANYTHEGINPLRVAKSTSVCCKLNVQYYFYG